MPGAEPDGKNSTNPWRRLRILLSGTAQDQTCQRRASCSRATRPCCYSAMTTAMPLVQRLSRPWARRQRAQRAVALFYAVREFRYDPYASTCRPGAAGQRRAGHWSWLVRDQVSLLPRHAAPSHVGPPGLCRRAQPPPPALSQTMNRCVWHGYADICLMAWRKATPASICHCEKLACCH
jgi:hypothetical protein